MSIGLKLAIGATVILALSVVGVLAAERFDNANQDDAVQARKTGANRDKATPVAKTLELGDVAKISSNYKVAVTEVTLYEGAETQYLAATIKATYTGTHEGEPWADLSVQYSAPRSQGSAESDCPIDVDDASDAPPLEAGDEQTYVVCIDLPTKETEKGKVSVEEAFSNGHRAYWSTEAADTKTMPSVAPPTPAAGLPGPPAPPQRGNRSDNDSDVEWTDEYDERLDDLRALKKYLDKEISAYKDTEGHDDDKLDDYEEWRDNTEKQIDYYEDLKARLD
ncbi:MAG TPA: hypothetical protein VMZ66_04900 [Aeromicrobium sp.]|nr:hypothetical protein [Aeromicrobium sp.]